MKTVYFVMFMAAVLCGCGTDTCKGQFAAFAIKDAQGVARITVDKDGEIKANGEVVGHIGKGGTVKDKDGKPIAKMAEGGMLQDEAGNTLAKIDNTGKVDNGSGVLMAWSERGELMKGNEKMGIAVSPVDKGSLQTASIVMFLYLSMR